MTNPMGKEKIRKVLEKLTTPINRSQLAKLSGVSYASIDGCTLRMYDVAEDDNGGIYLIREKK